MAIDSAKAFVKRMYTDDEFLKDLYRMGAFTGGTRNDPEAAKVQSRKFAEISTQVGYDFTTEEYDSANSEYIKSIGAWKGIKTIFHIMKIGKQVEKEQKRAGRNK